MKLSNVLVLWESCCLCCQDPSEMIDLKDLVGGGSVSLATREECARQHVFVLLSTISSNR